MKPEVGIADRLLAEVRQSPVDLRSPIDLLGIENAQIESKDGITRRHLTYGNGPVGLRGIDCTHTRAAFTIPNRRFLAFWSLCRCALRGRRRCLWCLAVCVNRNDEQYSRS